MYEFRLKGGKEGSNAVAQMIGIHRSLELDNLWPELAQNIIHPWFLKTARQNLASQGRMAGEQWNYSTEPAYAAFKQKMTGLPAHGRVMRWSPGMERLHPGLTDAASQWHIFRVGKRKVTIGVGLAYALRLTQGGIGPFGEPYPGRSLMPSLPNQKLSLYQEIAQFFKARFKQYREQRFIL